jgi:uncharacterized protein with HEPN domain
MDKTSAKDRAMHILTSIELIRSFIKNISEQEFLNDAKTQSAVQHQFLIIGEAVRSIDENILKEYDYPWHIPRSFRNYIIHVYHDIRLERIYYAAKDLDDLESQVRKMIKREFT